MDGISPVVAQRIIGQLYQLRTVTEYHRAVFHRRCILRQFDAAILSGCGESGHHRHCGNHNAASFSPMHGDFDCYGIFVHKK